MSRWLYFAADLHYGVDAMRKQLHYLLLIALGAMILGSLTTMMITFMGGRFTGTDLHGLLLAQIVSIPIAALLVGYEVAAFVRGNGWGPGLALLWQKIPAWLVLALVLLNSLVLIGELSVLLLDYLMGEALPWTEHVPLMALLTCSVAFAVIYGKLAQLYGSGVKSVGRWP